MTLCQPVFKLKLKQKHHSILLFSNAWKKEHGLYMMCRMSMDSPNEQTIKIPALMPCFASLRKCGELGLRLCIKHWRFRKRCRRSGCPVLVAGFISRTMLSNRFGRKSRAKIQNMVNTLSRVSFGLRWPLLGFRNSFRSLEGDLISQSLASLWSWASPDGGTSWTLCLPCLSLRQGKVLQSLVAWAPKVAEVCKNSQRNTDMYVSRHCFRLRNGWTYNSHRFLFKTPKRETLVGCFSKDPAVPAVGSDGTWYERNLNRHVHCKIFFVTWIITNITILLHLLVHLQCSRHDRQNQSSWLTLFETEKCYSGH